MYYVWPYVTLKKGELTSSECESVGDAETNLEIPKLSEVKSICVDVTSMRKVLVEKLWMH